MKLQPLNDVAETRLLISNMHEPTGRLDDTQTEQTETDDSTESAQPHKPNVFNEPGLNETPGPVDDYGTEWTSDIHSDPPKKTKTGRWYKKRGRAAGKASPAGTPSNPYNLAGKAAAALTIQGGVSCFGDEWLPVRNREYDEFANLENAFTVYFEAKDIQDFPPGIGLTIALCSYAVPRMYRPETKTRMGRIIGAIRKKWTTMRAGRKTVKASEKVETE